MKIFVGTSGYSYRDWIGTFYPKKTKSNAMLEYYAQHFPIAEINSTYYRLPMANMFEKMAEKTPKNFRFSVKANQKMTHKIEADFPKICKQFLQAISPLKKQSKFVGILFQFPYSFKNIPKHQKLLQRLREFIPNDPLFIEFRNSGWIQEDVFEMLKDNNLSYVSVDEPRFKSLVPPIVKATSNLGYVRFHGRNKSNWWKGSNISRYDYEYSSEQLSEWAKKINQLKKECDEVYVFFNNHPKGKAVNDAKRFQEMLYQKQVT